MASNPTMTLSLYTPPQPPARKPRRQRYSYLIDLPVSGGYLIAIRIVRAVPADNGQVRLSYRDGDTYSLRDCVLGEGDAVAVAHQMNHLARDQVAYQRIIAALLRSRGQTPPPAA